MNPVLKNDIASEASSVGAMSFSSNRINPKISVVMPFYNSEKYLREAVQSILDQSFSDFELILINDGSTDSSREVASSFKDPRIVLIDNPGNLGLSKSFNIGIKAARGEFIARMDADDIAYLSRFQKQLDFFTDHPAVSVLGTAVTLINEMGERIGGAKKPEKHELIKWQSLLSTPLFHPTVMARREVLKANLFDETLFNSEDYELWSRLLFTTRARFANLKEPLLYYRVFPSSFTRNLKPEKRKASALNSIGNIERYLPLSEKDKESIVALRENRKLSGADLRKLYFRYLKAGWKFAKVERLSFNETLSLYWSLHGFKLALLKHWLKHLIRG